MKSKAQFDNSLDDLCLPFQQGFIRGSGIYLKRLGVFFFFVALNLIALFSISFVVHQINKPFSIILEILIGIALLWGCVQIVIKFDRIVFSGLLKLKPELPVRSFGLSRTHATDLHVKELSRWWMLRLIGLATIVFLGISWLQSPTWFDERLGIVVLVIIAIVSVSVNIVTTINLLERTRDMAEISKVGRKRATQFKGNSTQIKQGREIPSYVSRLPDTVLEFRAVPLLDFEWIDAQLRNRGIENLLSIFEHQSPVDEERNREIKLVQSTLRMSADIISRDPNLLAGQLLGRLIGYKEPMISALLHQAKNWREHAWLQPIQRCLPGPGGDEIYTKVGHSGSVKALAISSDGRRGVSGSIDNTLKVWDLASGELLHTLEGHFYRVTALAISPDGRRGVSGFRDGILDIWDLVNGELPRILERHTSSVEAVAISPDGRLAVSGSWDNTLKVWDLDSGELLRTLEGHTSSVNAVAISPDGRMVVSGSGDKTLKVWDLDSGELLRTLEGHTNRVNAVAIRPDGRMVVSGSVDGTLTAWDLDSGELLRTLEGHTGSVDAVAISPDGHLAVSGSWDNTLMVWDISNNACCASFICNGSVTACGFSRDGKTIIAGDTRGGMYFLRLVGMPELNES